MKNILIVDDEKVVLKMFEHLLPLYGYDVLTAEDGQTAIEIFERERPIAVITDIKMPRMDGIEVLKIIKSINPKAKVIIMTGYGDDELRKQAFDLKADEYLDKPFNCNILDDALERLGRRMKPEF